MWVFLTHGFVSVVQHKDEPGMYQVKSRASKVLEQLWPDEEIQVIEWADYRFRISLQKEKVLGVLSRVADSIGYSSFKHECRDDQDYLESLGRIWNIMLDYQSKLELEERGRQ